MKWVKVSNYVTIHQEFEDCEHYGFGSSVKKAEESLANSMRHCFITEH